MNPAPFDLVLRNARVATASDTFCADIGMAGGRIVQLGGHLAGGAREIDAARRVVTSGGVDAHRHLDQPMALSGRLADDFTSGTRSAAAAARPPQALQALAERAVDEDGADVIVLAGAPPAGLARSLQGRLPVPVVDGVSSPLRHAESLVVLQSGQAQRGSFAPPPIKPKRGRPAAIEALLRRE